MTRQKLRNPLALVNNQNNIQAPLVLIGRGGSGTRLFSEVFLNAGVFFGSEINPTNDSMEWRDVIYEAAITKLEENIPLGDLSKFGSVKRFRENAAKVLSQRPENSVHWGWKLPETMFVLPEVLKAFPEARIVHVVRHPVTCCIRKRHVTSDPNHRVGKSVLRAAYPNAGVAREQTDLNEGIMHNSVSWLYQVAAVQEIGEKMANSFQLTVVRYEDLFDDWDQVASSLSAAIGVPASQLNRPVLEEGRRQQFQLPDSRVEKVWELCGEVAVKFGYRISESGEPIVEKRTLQ